ncbi:MAG: hypothetical protein D6695_01875 [Planctomycetota bacterium]|nr:MAG: hypothetical protein D6695_01875 [Planctomycetota bacterium]
MKLATVVCLLSACSASGWAQFQSVVDSPHNLSTSGPGVIRATTEEQVCIFCHATHNSSPVRPLWNRAMPVDAYSVYTSRALDAQPGQPTGSSKMCLSCHDGTIALGAVVSRTVPISMMGGVTTMPPGPGLIGTDLRDDHPISFRYDSALATQDSKLRLPSQLPPELHLDANSELQCTTCHDAHNNARGNFLVMNNTNSQMCTSCHQMGTTAVSAHEDCASCHQPHSAPSGPYLLRAATVAQTCLACHDGSVPGAPDIESSLSSAYIHETYSQVDPDEPYQAHVSCADCHEPHTIGSGSSSAPLIHPSFGEVPGVSASGALLNAASYEYEVCFRCHAEGATVEPHLPRRIVQNNTRQEFSTSAISFHPVEGPGRNADVPSLLPGWTTSSVMYCTDCHSSDMGQQAGGNGPDGLHGSNQDPLLIARYSTADFTRESASAYELCYSCHSRQSILNDESFEEHEKHIVDERAPCSACHDAHGISSLQGSSTGNSHLINFRTDIVFPDRRTGRLEFRDTGFRRGECFLRCHGEDHSPEDYHP